MATKKYTVPNWGAMGALPDGRNSDLSEWPGSVSDAAAPSARRALRIPTGGKL